jgi:translation initiation factor 2 subunit 1
MLLKKQGYPEEGELVLCKVTKVSYNAVFAVLMEYSRTGLIHISEVSPGRIRNLNNYVKVGKQIVCKVLRVNEKKGHIDLSLRRVNDNQKRKKLDLIKLELKAEKIIEDVAKELEKDKKDFYEKVSKVPMQEYGLVYPVFEAVIEEGADLSILNLTDKENSALLKIIKERIKPKRVEILGDITVKTYEENGVDVVKKALNLVLNANKEKLTIKYLGASKFRLKLTAHDYDEAEDILKKGLDAAKKYCEKNNAEFDFKKTYYAKK